eukprot:363221-Chlamydomonas_euryale.AAC.2
MCGLCGGIHRVGLCGAIGGCCALLLCVRLLRCSRCVNGAVGVAALLPGDSTTPPVVRSSPAQDSARMQRSGAKLMDNVNEAA